MGDLESGRIVAGQVEESFLNELVSRLRSCKEVLGILLAGSGAHGELLWWEEKGSRKLLSDVEVGVITNALGKRGLLKNIASEAGRRYAYEVELFTITPRRLRLGSPKNLSFLTMTLLRPSASARLSIPSATINRMKRKYSTLPGAHRLAQAPCRPCAMPPPCSRLTSCHATQP